MFNIFILRCIRHHYFNIVQLSFLSVVLTEQIFLYNVLSKASLLKWCLCDLLLWKMLLKHVLNVAVVDYNWHLLSVPLEKGLAIHSQQCTDAASTFHTTSLRFTLKQSEISLKFLSSLLLVYICPWSCWHFNLPASHPSGFEYLITFSYEAALLCFLRISLLPIRGSQHVERMCWVKIPALPMMHASMVV